MYVYVIQGEKPDAPLKIGVSADVKTRLMILQTAHYENLYLRCLLTCVDRDSASVVEKTLHGRYALHWIRGEWFNLALNTLIEDLESTLRDSLTEMGVQNFEVTQTKNTVKDNVPLEKRLNVAGKQLNFCVQWLLEHPEDQHLSGKKLNWKVKMQGGLYVSFKTWHKAKNLIEPRSLTPEMQQAIEWLKVNPNMQGLNQRKAAEAAGVSEGTINYARLLISRE